MYNIRWNLKSFPTPCYCSILKASRKLTKKLEFFSFPLFDHLHIFSFPILFSLHFFPFSLFLLSLLLKASQKVLQYLSYPTRSGGYTKLYSFIRYNNTKKIIHFINCNNLERILHNNNSDDHTIPYIDTY